MNLGGKKIFLIGFLVVLLIGIPLTVYLLQQQQEVRSRAEKSTTIAFTPDSTQAAPLQKAVGDTIPLDITVDPGKNQISWVKLEIQYDPEVLATASANAFQANVTAFPLIFQGPVYSPGKIIVELAVGADPTKVIQQKVKAATITFTALKNTSAGTPTIVSFGASPNTSVLSASGTDQGSEDVLSSTIPALIAIGGNIVSPTSPIPPGEATPTVPLPELPSPTPTFPADVPTPTVPSPSEFVTPTVTPTFGPSSSTLPPVCSSLTADRALSGNAPFSVTFTANGTDADGTINKVTFNFGDGQQTDLTTSGGIGTASVNAPASHTYNNPGTYQASAILTDSTSGVSTPNDNCKQTITVTATSTTGTTGGTGGGNPTKTVPATGSYHNALAIGSVVLLLIVGGGFIFFLI